MRPARIAALLLPAMLGACAGTPPPPAWQANASGAMDRAVVAYLEGDSRMADAELERARREIARTGRPELMARAELMMCAARVASLAFGPCEGFERLRADARVPERAYADHLQARALAREDVERLPAAQRGAARAVAAPGARSLDAAAIEDPLARLIAVAVLFQAGQASPDLIVAAADTASAQGWRRPLLAWLQVLALRAERAGDHAEAQRLRRSVELVQHARPR